MLLPKPPERHRNRQPQERGAAEHDGRGVLSEFAPNQACKACQAEGALDGAGAVQGGGSPCSNRPMKTPQLLFAPLTLCDERRTGWENRRKSEEQPADDGAEVFGDEPCGHRDQATKHESQHVLMPPDRPQSTRIHRDPHGGTLSKKNKPARALPSQSKSPKMATTDTGARSFHIARLAAHA